MDQNNLKFTCILSKSNWHEFYLQASNILPSFGDAGIEVINGILTDWSAREPVATAQVTFKQRQADNTVIELQRNWIKEDGVGLQSQLVQWNKEKRDYSERRNKVWALLTSSCDIQISNSLHLDPEFKLALEDQWNTVRLFNLMRSKTQGSIGDIHKIRISFFGVKQSESEASLIGLNNYLGRMESIVGSLNGTPQSISPQDQLNALATSCLVSRYISVISQFNTAEAFNMGHLWNYDSLKRLIIQHEESLSNMSIIDPSVAFNVGTNNSKFSKRYGKFGAGVVV